MQASGNYPTTKIFDSAKGNNESYSTRETQKASTEECMRYIIHYRQNVDSILAWKIIHNRYKGERYQSTKSSKEDLKKVYLNSGKSDSTGDQGYNREQKEGIPRILVTGDIIGDQPGVNRGIFPRHLSSERRAEKENSTYRMGIRFHKEIRILLN